MKTSSVPEGNDIWFVSRLLRPDNVIVSQADINAGADAFQVRVYDMTKPSLGTGQNGREVLFKSYNKSAITTILLTATDSSALTNDGYWNGIDDEGYNFIFPLRNSGGTAGTDSFPFEAGHRYQVEFMLDATSAGYGKIRWAEQFYVESLLSL